MKNPFTVIPDDKTTQIVQDWVKTGAVENVSCGDDLISYDDEWKDFTLGQVKKLGEIAGFTISVEGIDLNLLLKSKVITENYEDQWIQEIEHLDELYLDILLDYINSINKQPEDHIKIA